MEELWFWRGISILIRNYNAVNKRIFAYIIDKVYLVENGIKELISSDFTQNIFEQISCRECQVEELYSYLEAGTPEVHKPEAIIFQFKCIAKKQISNINGLGIIDFSNTAFICKFDCSTFENYRIFLQNGELRAECISRSNSENPQEKQNWLEFMLLPKLKKWCENSNVKSISDTTQLFPTTSLQQVDVAEYAEIYKTLKSKYVQTCLEFWKNAQENTDPLKFIHEDLAIAAYLIAFWQRTNTKPIAFADLGCGNGLLVYVLSQEGYCGYGYDIRARRIWAQYPSSTNLVEQVINAYDINWLPKQVDWLIGNHSDELSPWLPVIAATSDYKMRFFLLPCCAFELSGNKFQRRNSRLSTFQDFYVYAQQLSKQCGYITLQDRLKIPSTKRLALMGIQRIYSSDKQLEERKNIFDLVARERKTYASTGPELKIREKTEAVRNCTKLDKDIILNLVLHIFFLMMNISSSPKSTSTWQRGKNLHLREIAKSLKSEELKQIKAECGGIKTLLRNHHAIFECFGQDIYGIRKPQPFTIDPTATIQKTFKKRICFFKKYHPDSCPLDDNDCSFIH